MRIFVKYAERLKLYYKQISLFAVVPFLILLVIVPFMYFYDARNAVSYEQFCILLQNDLNLFLPLVPSWCGFFVLKEYIDSKGNEVLFLYGNRIKLQDYFLVSVLIWLLDILELCVIVIANHVLMRFAFCLLLTQIFVFILLYSMTFLSGSITASMLAIMAYFIVCQVVLINKSIPFVFTSVFDYSSGREMKTVFLPMLVSVPILLLTGVIANKRYIKYN